MPRRWQPLSAEFVLLATRWEALSLVSSKVVLRAWAEPEFSKLQACLASAMMSINAAKGFDYGSGFDALPLLGSQLNDSWTTTDDGRIKPLTNYSGGIQGGISNGEDIYFRVAFKPAPTLLRDQQTVDVAGKPVTMQGKGRHDPCVLPVPSLSSRPWLLWWCSTSCLSSSRSSKKSGQDCL